MQGLLDTSYFDGVIFGRRIAVVVVGLGFVALVTPRFLGIAGRFDVLDSLALVHIRPRAVSRVRLPLRGV